NLEDELREFSPLGVPGRDSKDRAFDDLSRLYFVAFSRSQDVLLLVGLKPVMEGYVTQQGPRTIPNVASGWDRNNNCIGLKEILFI
ncbi:MAG: ATP-dependent helicase, partial [Methanobacteriaceae archaeon]|nr:ATP-dependent helicase [Methanobacteriaceae archaeon]